MSKLKCVLALLLLAIPLQAQRLTARLGNPAAKNLVISAQILHEGSFTLQRSFSAFTNWVSLTNFNAFPGTNTFTDPRTNKQSYYRLVRLNVPAELTSEPVGSTNFPHEEVRLEANYTGSWPIRFQWYKDSAPIAGANTNKLLLTNRADHTGRYQLIASNLWGQDVSATVNVKTINPANTNIAGKKIRYVIRGREGNYIGAGTYDTTYFSVGNYSTISENEFLNDQGFWQYGALTTTGVGRILMNQSFIYPNGAAMDLTFTNHTSGTFLLRETNRPGGQRGDFTFIP